MKKILLLIFPLFLFGYTDLGKEGFSYKIKEPNFLTMLEDGVKEINQKEVKQKLKSDLIKQATGEDNLNFCKETKEIKEFDYITLEEDLYTPTGKLYQEKGTKMSSFIPKELNICFVDGNNLTLLQNQIDFFDKETNNKCVYMITNRNVLDVYKIYPKRNRDMFPSKKLYEDRFKVECAPTRVKLIHNDRIKYQYSIDRFKTRGN